MIERQETTIEEVRYSFLPLGATAARKNLINIMQLFGPAIADFVKGLEGLGSIGDIDLAKMTDKDGLDVIRGLSSSFSEGIRSLVKGLNIKEYETLVNDFVVNRVKFFDEEKGEWKTLTKVICEEKFATKLSLELRILCWTLTEQYDDFFMRFRQAVTSIAANIGKAEKKAK